MEYWDDLPRCPTEKVYLYMMYMTYMMYMMYILLLLSLIVVITIVVIVIILTLSLYIYDACVMCLADWSTLLQSMHIHAKLASLRAGAIPSKVTQTGMTMMTRGSWWALWLEPRRNLSMIILVMKEPANSEVSNHNLQISTVASFNYR